MEHSKTCPNGHLVILKRIPRNAEPRVEVRQRWIVIVDVGHRRESRAVRRIDDTVHLVVRFGPVVRGRVPQSEV